MKPSAILLPVCLLTLTSCASIVSKSHWPVYIGTDPAGATVSITNKKGKSVYEGITPVATTLKSGSGFFSKELYRVKISMNGYDDKTVTIKSKLNTWYPVNLFFGNLIGLLIVDPATGAMYTLDTDYVNEELNTYYIKRVLGIPVSEPRLQSQVIPKRAFLPFLPNH